MCVTGAARWCHLQVVAGRAQGAPGQGAGLGGAAAHAAALAAPPAPAWLLPSGGCLRCAEQEARLSAALAANVERGSELADLQVKLKVGLFQLLFSLRP